MPVVAQSMSAVQEPILEVEQSVAALLPAHGESIGRARHKRVLILQGMCKQYRVPLYLAMHRELAEAGIDLKVAYSAPFAEHKERNDDADLPPGVGIRIKAHAWLKERLLLQLPVREILQADLIIVEHALKHLVNYPLLVLSMLRLKRVALWVHGGTMRHRSAPLPRTLRRMSLIGADWAFAYTAKVREELVSLGVPAERTTALQNAIDLSSFRAALAQVSTAELAAARARLGLPPNAHVALFCGSLYPGRGVDFLVEAADRIASRDPRFHLLVLGSGPLQPQLDEHAAARRWLHPIGPVFGAARAVYFRLAQVALMPYLAGLGILDAMAAGLPYIVTGANCFNPEIDYLVDGVTGLVTGDDASTYADQVHALLTDEQRTACMSRAARIASEEYSIEAMAGNFVRGIHSCLASLVNEAVRSQ